MGGSNSFTMGCADCSCALHACYLHQIIDGWMSGSQVCINLNVGLLKIKVERQTGFPPLKRYM